MKLISVILTLLVSCTTFAEIDSITIQAKVTSFDKKTVMIEYMGKKKALNRDALPKDLKLVSGETIPLKLTPQQYDQLKAGK